VGKTVETVKPASSVSNTDGPCRNRR